MMEKKTIRAPEIDEMTEADMHRRDRIEDAMMILVHNTWFDYERANKIFDELDRAYMQAYKYYENPNKYTDIRPISLFLTGEVNTGKTTLAVKYQHYCENQAKRKGLVYSKDDIVIVDAPVGITFRGMFEYLLEEFNIEIHLKMEKIHTNRLITMLIKELRKRKVKLLLIDDIQNMTSTSQKEKDEIFKGFRRIVNQSQTRLVLVGLPNAYKLFEDSNWVDERFRALNLPKWNPYSTEYLDLLFTIHNAFRDFLPDWDLVSKEGTLNKDLALFLHEISDGRLGKLIQTIKQAAVHAITNQRTNILREDYEHVQTMHYILKDGRLEQENVDIP
jgi:DNA replication protein DnaC